nr:hypothetical protein [Lysobacter enzymogenes]
MDAARAPEWLYRLGREPRRLWRRYLLGGAVFIARALRLAAQPPRPASGIAPLSEASTTKADTRPCSASTRRASRNWCSGSTPARAPASAASSSSPARAGEGATALAHSYAAASAQLRKRRVLLLSDDAQGDVACFADCFAQAAAAGAPGLTLARLTDPRREFRDNYAALDDADAWQALAQRFDEVVVDARAPYALAAAKHASGVVVVVEAEATRAALVRTLLDDLAAVDARVIGTVLNKHRSHLPHALHERL